MYVELLFPVCSFLFFFFSDCLPLEHVSNEMGLSDIHNRVWSVIAISALETEGIDKAMRELCRLLDEQKASMP